MSNIGENLPLIKQGRSENELRGKASGAAVVVGAGPSIWKFNLLDEVKGLNALYIVVDRMQSECLKRDIVPDYVVSVDGAPKITDFYTPLSLSQKKTKYVAASQIHPSVSKNLPPEKTYWFHCLYDKLIEEPEPSVSRALFYMTGGKIPLLNAQGNVGGFSCLLAFDLGCTTIVPLGLDFSYGPDAKIEETLYWDGFKSVEGGEHEAGKHYSRRKTDHGYDVLTDSVMAGYAEALQLSIEEMKVEVLNPNPFSILSGRYVKAVSLEAVKRRL